MIDLIMILCFLVAGLAIVKCLININEIDKRIEEVIAEEKRQNKRIDLLEKCEQVRQSEEQRDKAYIETKNLFKKW